MNKKMIGKIVFALIMCVSMSISLGGKLKVEAASSEPFIGQICLMPYTFVPIDWLECNGQSLNSAQYPSLNALLGSKFGGDGINTFKVPNLGSPIPYVKYFIATNGVIPSDTEMGVDFLIGQIELFPNNIIPYGWKLCNGDILTVADNPSLHSIIGNTYGGNGSTDFKLPDLRGTEPNENLHYCIETVGLYPDVGSYSNMGDLIGSINLYTRTPQFSGNGVCDGGLLPVTSNQALYALLFLNFGGTANTTFGKPELVGAAPHPALSYYVQTSGIFPMRN